MNKSRAAALTLSLAVTIGAAASIGAAPPLHAAGPPQRLAQAMVPPTGMGDAEEPMPVKEHYQRRFPQAARVGDLIGLPVLDLKASTIGYVRQIVRTPQDKIRLIVSYSRLWGWYGRPIAVPLEVLGIEGRQLVSLDMTPSQYAAAPTWQANDDIILPPDATVRVALARN